MIPLRNEPEPWPTIAVFDIETTNWIDVELLCHVDELGTRRSFKTISAYLDYLTSPDFTGDHIWAHYGGKFDFRFILPEITRREIRWRGVWSGSQLIAVTIHPMSKDEITFIDSSRLMPSSVASIGKTVGLAKLDVDRTRIQNLTPAEVEEYCFRDCDIVVKGLQNLRDALGASGADFAYTLASIASRYVRRGPTIDWKRVCWFNRQSRQYEYGRRMQQMEDFCFPAYFGGRCEVFRRGQFVGKIYYYDIRSSYPHSMTRPLPLYFKGFRPATKQSVRQQLGTVGISQARVKVPFDTYLPILPIFHEDRLSFPTGSFEGVWTHIELLAALDAGVEVELTCSAIFEAKEFLRPFVDTFYNLRQKAMNDGDEFKKYAFKILLNSLYGKLLETERKEALIFGRDEYAEAVSKHGRESIFGTEVPGVFSVRSFEEGKFRHVAAGAYVTAYSRLLLHRKLREALDKGGDIFYCDTDSIVCDVPLTEGDALGDLKLEHTLEWAEFVAPKVYRGKDANTGEIIYRVKGIPVGGYEPGEAESRWDRYNSGIEVDKEGISGLKTDLKLGQLEPRAVTLKRALRRFDRKRIHVGVDSRPFVLDR